MLSILKILELKKSLEDLIRKADAERAGELLFEFRTGYPNAFELIGKALTGTPDAVLAKLEFYIPGVGAIPNAANVVASIQSNLQTRIRDSVQPQARA